MKTLANLKNVNHWLISSKSKGQILKMQELKKQIGQTINPNVFLRKNTMAQVKSEMKKVFGKVLKEIPKSFILNNCIWKANITVYTSKNKEYESFTFIPFYNI